MRVLRDRRLPLHGVYNYKPMLLYSIIYSSYICTRNRTHTCTSMRTYTHRPRKKQHGDGFGTRTPRMKMPLGSQTCRSSTNKQTLIQVHAYKVGGLQYCNCPDFQRFLWITLLIDDPQINECLCSVKWWIWAVGWRWLLWLELFIFSVWIVLPVCSRVRKLLDQMRY